MNLTEQTWLDEYTSSSPVDPFGEANLTPLSLFSGYLARDLLSSEPSSLSVWEEVMLNPIRAFLKKPGKSLRRDFVTLGWRLAWELKHIDADSSGYGPLDPLACPPCPETLVTLIELLHTGSLIIDDIEDQSETRRGQPCLHHQIGLAPALNLGNWLYFVSTSLVDRLSDDVSVRAELYQALNRVMLKCHQGQAIDVSCRVIDHSREKINQLTTLSTRLKTGVLVGFALELGAIYLRLSHDRRLQLAQFGEQVGLSLQMYDDLSGLMNESRWHKGCEDLSRARLTWVWALLAEHEEVSAEQFTHLIQSLRALAQPPHIKVSELLNQVEWRRSAERLRDLCLPHLREAPAHITQVIKSALDRLGAQLECPNVTVIARDAIERLKTSYL